MLEKVRGKSATLFMTKDTKLVFGNRTEENILEQSFQWSQK